MNIAGSLVAARAMPMPSHLFLQLTQLSQSALTRPTVLIVVVLIVQTRANASSGIIGLTSNGSMPSMPRYVNAVLMLALTLTTFVP